MKEISNCVRDSVWVYVGGFVRASVRDSVAVESVRASVAVESVRASVRDSVYFVALEVDQETKRQMGNL